MYVGFDIGGTTIKYGVVDEVGNILEKSSIATNYDKTAFYNDLVSIIEDAQQRYTIKGVGISAPGVVQKDGYMLTAGAIRPLYGENFKVVLEARTGLPVTVENDANAVAIAEKWIGNAQDFDNYLCLVLGTGVGGGIVINGQVYRGAHGMAGEFGWTVIKDLPATGDIEEVSVNKKTAVAGGLVKLYNKALQLKNPQAERLNDAREIFQLAEAGDVLAEEITRQFYLDLAVCLINLISCFDPEAILLGGGVSSNEIFHRRLQETLVEVESRHESINALRGKTIAPVISTNLKNDAGLIGAVYQIHQLMK
ncbi:beta-glucoside kinase [Enterococcus sp. PF1-24]|uniref:ROK family protein n=1 Tax=unclassified Enterococcus TaxID=2608891 RepID=UPI002472EE30|nr:MULTISPECIES: ROK family protein [unclassified Enterococcus]MDH6364922.1 beta-glucoside kinase [Enterococcus sp. PFB1-1]MDH6402023.1 beta-glucoside kinase [Enterococcus sp. PF1-24]